MIDMPVRRRIVGAALRRYRQERGYALNDAARLLECDRSKISRIETGQRGIRNRELRDLLTEYGAGQQLQDVLVKIANPLRTTGWWWPYTDVLPDTNHDLFALELIASPIMIFAAQHVPSLLQTPDYASEVAALGRNMPAIQARRLRDAWRARQEAVLVESRATVTVIIGEAALRQAVGGSNVMRTQLAALADACRQFPALSIQVLPFSAAHPVGDINSFTILRYTEAPDIGVVHMSGVSGDVFFDGDVSVTAGTTVFEKLRACSLGPEASARLIRDIGRRYAESQYLTGGDR